MSFIFLPILKQTKKEFKIITLIPGNLVHCLFFNFNMSKCHP